MPISAMSTLKPEARTLALSRIAEMLGCPVEAFHDELFNHDLSSTLRFVALWAALKSEESRVAVLKLLRELVEAESS